MTDRIQKLQQICLETGASLSNDLPTTKNDNSCESPNSPSFNLSQSSSSEDLEKPVQVTNSIISGLSSNSQISLVSNIKRKNLELKQSCKEKLQELHSTTKEFLSRNRSSSKISLPDEETPEHKSLEIKNSQDMKRSKSDPCLSNVLSELSQLRKQLDQANIKITESRTEMERQSEESRILKSQLSRIISSNTRQEKLQMCECKII
jgi:hypothetical protein